MKKSFARKPLSVLLSLLMVLSMFAGLAFTASAMNIFVKTLTGKHVTLDVEPDDTIAAVRTKIEEKEEMSIADLVLVFAGQTLEDENTLQDYSIQKDSTLHLMAKIRYIDETGAEQIKDDGIYTVVSNTSVDWTSGWYVVNGSVTINSRITVTGDVYLILCDGAVLTAGQGVNVGEGQSLTIYGQTEGSGMLSATGGNNCAGIGGGEFGTCGSVTINGGTVSANGGSFSAGIGGGSDGAGGSITINGGTVTATGGEGGAGIGGGTNCGGGTIIVNGGTVTATGGANAAAIGCGEEGEGGSVTYNGGTVNGVSYGNPDTQEHTYSVGDTIEFGTYPQTKVTDANLIASLSSAEKTWTSYRYYSGTGSSEYDGLQEPGDWMRFADFFYAGEKYRAVTFDLYRPRWLYWKAEATGSAYNDVYGNGYRINTVYYFKYEPLVWRVLDPQTGFVITENIIDSQSLCNVIYHNPSDGYYYRGIDSTVFSNDYAASDLRQWMNSNFYATAFSDAQKDGIAVSDIETGLRNKIFYLSRTEANAMGTDAQRLAYGTDYAKSQGLYVNAGGDGVGASPWTLRTPYGSDGGSVFQVTLTRGAVSSSASPVRNTGWGVRLACRLESLVPDTDVSEFLLSEHLEEGHTPGEAVKENNVAPTCVNGGSYVSVTCCTVCGGEISRVPVTVPATGEHDWKWVTDQAATCAETGLAHQVCKTCGAVQNENTILDLTDDHVYGDDDWTDGVFADCGNDGSIGYFTCERCSQRFDTEGNLLSDDDIVIPATGEHDWQWVTDEEADCYTDGVQHQYCTVCEQTQNEGTPIPAAHEFDAWTPAVAPTCGKDGTVGYQHCRICGDNFDAQGNLLESIVDPATGNHTYSNDGWTHFNAGQHVRYCEVCGLAPEYEDHDVIVRGGGDATCIDEGYTGDEFCSVCGERLSEGEIIPPKGHTTEIVNAKEATATEDGYTGDEVCTVCGETIKAGEVIPATGGTTPDEPDTPDTPTDGVCPLCGKTHTAKWVRVLHYILYILLSPFRK